jgi:hypothetical protein
MPTVHTEAEVICNPNEEGWGGETEYDLLHMVISLMLPSMSTNIVVINGRECISYKSMIPRDHPVTSVIDLPSLSRDRCMSDYT